MIRLNYIAQTISAWDSTHPLRISACVYKQSLQVGNIQSKFQIFSEVILSSYIQDKQQCLGSMSASPRPPLVHLYRALATSSCPYQCCKKVNLNAPVPLGWLCASEMVYALRTKVESELHFYGKDDGDFFHLNIGPFELISDTLSFLRTHPPFCRWKYPGRATPLFVPLPSWIWCSHGCYVWTGHPVFPSDMAIPKICYQQWWKSKGFKGACFNDQRQRGLPWLHHPSIHNITIDEIRRLQN